MKSAYVIFALIVITTTLTSVVCVTLTCQYGIEGEGNVFIRFLFGEVGAWAFPVFDVVGVLFVYFVATILKKYDVRVASSYLLTMFLFCISDLANDIHVLVTEDSLFPMSVFFLLVSFFLVLSLYLFGTNRVPPLKF